MLRRLALSGLKGRPKQTIILLTTMILAFFFVTIAMNLLSTSQINRAVQRRDTFGEWSNVFIADTAERRQALQAEGLDFGENRILGLDARFGIVAAYDERFLELSRIDVLEGHMPQKLDEIVLTESQVSFFPEKPKVGDTVTVTLEVSRSDDVRFQLHPDVEPAIRSDIAAANQYIAEHWEEIGEKVRSDQFAWEDSQTVAWSAYLRNIKGFGITVDEVAERERYTKLMDGSFERKLALFSDQPETIDERLAAIAAYNQSETEIQVEEAFTDPFITQWYGRDLSKDEMRSEVLNMYTFEGQIGRFMSEAIPRNSSDLEGREDTIYSTRVSSGVVRYSPSQLAILSPLFQHLPASGIPGIPMEQNFIRRSEIVLHRDMVISGIIENYQQVWDGPITQYATGFVTEETAHQMFEEGLFHSQIETNQAYQTPWHLFILADTPEVIEQQYPDQLNLFSNNLAFGQESGMNEDLLSFILLVIIALITCFSIFQISLIQFRKRLRKLALLRAIGASFSQLRQLLSWESVYLIAWALPVGAILGFVLSYLLVWFNNLATGDRLIMQLNPGWLLLGYGLTLVSIVVGLFLPMLRIKQVPLRGHVPITNKKTVKSTRELLGDLPIAKQSLSSINRRHHRFVRKQQWINLGLMSAIVLILIGSYLLIYLAFGNYREKTLHADMPDFELEAPFQQSRRKTRELIAEFEAIPGVQRAEIFSRGLKAFLWYDGITQTPLNQAFQALIPEELVTEHFGANVRYEVSRDDSYRIQEAALTDIYGIVPESDLERSIIRLMPENFDLEAFQVEMQAILLLPSYQLNEGDHSPVDMARLESIDRSNRMREVLQLSGAGSISYDIRRSPKMLHDHDADALTSVQLTIPTGASLGPDNRPTNHVKQYDVPIVKVLYYLPEEGFWPLSDSVQSPILFVSQYTMDALYPYRMHSVFTFDTVRRYFGDDPAIRFGSTIIQVDQSDITPELATEVKRLGFHNGYYVKSLYLQKQALYTKGVRTSLIIGLLAATLLLIAIQIQTGSFRGQLEVERQRIGILQSLGVTEVDFRQAYRKEAIIRVIQAIILAHVTLGIGLIIYGLVAGGGGGLWTELKIALWDYNPWWHVALLIIFSVLGFLATYLPVGQILRRKPVENIRSLN